MARHEGGCMCGAVRYELDDAGSVANYCHCRSCRMATGGPVAAFVDLKPGAFSWTKGPARFFESSPGVRRGFCASCGTALTYEADDSPDEVHVMSPTLDDPAPFAPTGFFYEEERLSWLHLRLSGETS